MAKVMLSKSETKIWKEATASDRKDLANAINAIGDAINMLAGDLGGYGIDFVDSDGNDLSHPTNEELQFSYAPRELDT